MSTKATAKTTAKKARCKMASPISNDRAEAFVGPQAEVCPRFSEVPSERDARAFDLQAKGMTQRKIAQELKTSQSTVHRGIKKYRFWFGSTLPEDRGELTGFARFRVAVEEQRIFLRHQRELAMEEWHQSRQPVPMKRKRTRLDPKGRKMDGMPIKDIQIDEYMQRRHASAAHLNAAARRSLELTMLEAGYLGVRKLTCDQAIDTDERHRWDRAVKSRDAKIEELTRNVAELEAKFAALGSGVFGTSDSPLPSTPQPKSPDPLARQAETRAERGAQPRGTGVFGGCVIPEAQSLAPKTPDPGHESRTTSRSPIVNQTSPAPEVASPIQKAPSDDRPDSPRPVSQTVNQVNQEPRRRLVLASHNSACVPLKESELLKLEQDGLAWLAEVGEVIAALEPINECDRLYHEDLKTLWRNCDRNYREHGIIPERQKLPRLEVVRRGLPFTMMIPKDCGKFSPA
jgi:hypothetical protein